MAAAYAAIYRRYCWPVSSVDDHRLAPFHLLATEGRVHVDKDHEWHLETLADLCSGDDRILMATPYRTVELDDEESCGEATAWWEALTESGGEGMVVKPRDFVAESRIRRTVHAHHVLARIVGR